MQALRHGLLVALVLLATPVLASAQPTTALFRATLVAYGGLSGADIYETGYVLGAGRGREANPIFAPISHNPIAAGFVKMSLSTGTILTLVHIYPKHPKLAIAGALINVAIAGFVVVHNAQFLPPSPR